MHEANALFRRVPALADIVPFVPIGQFPTRIDACTVRAPDGSTRSIFVKREDLCHPVYGGNKIRKLEFLLAEAKRRDAKRLITVGAAGSHHALATTVHGRALGFDVTLVLFPQPLTPHVRDVLLMDHAFGAEIRWTSRMEIVPLAMLRARLSRDMGRSFVIAAGGSDAAGTLGWVGAGLELAEQIEAGEMPRPVAIYVAAGTLGTAAGLALGLAMAGFDIPVRAVRITSRLITNERTLANLVHGAAALLARAGVAPPVERALAAVELCHGQIGRGYGWETDGSRFAMEAFGEAGLRLDGTYTAKAAAELLARAEEGPVLFVHTLSAAEPVDRALTGGDGLPPPVAAYLAGAGG